MREPNQKHIDMLDRAVAHLLAIGEELGEDIVAAPLAALNAVRDELSAVVHVEPTGSTDTPLSVGGSIAPTGDKG